MFFFILKELNRHILRKAYTNYKHKSWILYLSTHGVIMNSIYKKSTGDMNERTTHNIERESHVTRLETSPLRPEGNRPKEVGAGGLCRIDVASIRIARERTRTVVLYPSEICGQFAKNKRTEFDQRPAVRPCAEWHFYIQVYRQIATSCRVAIVDRYLVISYAQQYKYGIYAGYYGTDPC